MGVLSGLCLAAVWATTAVAAEQPSSGTSEDTISRSGILREEVGDDFKDDSSTTAYTLESPSGGFTRVLPTAVEAQPGEGATVSGQMHGGELVGAVEPTGGLVQAQATGADGEPVLRPHKVAVLLVRLPGDPEAPWQTQQTLREQVFTAPNSANAFYQDESYGQLSLVGKLSPEGDVFGPYTLKNVPTKGCPYGQWQVAAEEAAEAEGVSLAGYDHIVIDTTPQLCGWNGLADVDGRHVYLNGNASSQTAAHEIGHNLGFQHASSMECTGSAGAIFTVSDGCTVREYGDPFDVMGGGFLRHNNSQRLALLGILSPQNVETVLEDGTYTISSALYPTESPTTLKIPARRDQEGTLSWYYLEIRQQGGVFENVEDASMTGVSIRLGPDTSREGYTYLLDNNPGGETDLAADSPLKEGQTFEDGTTRVTTLSARNGTATVSVEIGKKWDIEAPTPPEGLTAVVAPEESVDLSWQMSTDDVGVSRYRVLRDGTLVGFTPTPTFTDTDVAVGQHAYVVYAEDADGNHSASSNAAVVTVADTQPPTAPSELVAIAEPDGVKLRWHWSNDNGGEEFHYLVFRDGVSIGQTHLTTSFNDFQAPPGQHSYVVYAEDEAGNRSPPSQPVSVTVPDVQPPTQPKKLAAAVTAEDAVELSWQASTDDVGVSRYVVFRDGESIGEAETTTFSDPDPSPGQHSYVVYAEDEAGNRSSHSTQALVSVADHLSPSPPTGLTVAGGREDAVELSWQPSTDDVGVSRYVVYRDGESIGETATTSFADASAPAGEHFYVVYAEDAAGNKSAGSAPTLARVADTTAPTAPQGLSAAASAGDVKLSWQPSTDDVGVGRYVVYRDGESIGIAETTSFTDAAAPAGEHAYVVYAEDAAGNRSAPSAPATVLVAPTPPPSSPSGQAPADGGHAAAPGPTAPIDSRPGKPLLKVSRGKGGAIRLEADARRDPGVVRLELWLEGRLLGSSEGQPIRLTLKAGELPCASSFQVSARAYDAAGAKAVSKVLMRKAPGKGRSGAACGASRERRGLGEMRSLARSLAGW